MKAVILAGGAGSRITGEGTPMERRPSESRVSAFCHDGFWPPMDTLRDKNQLEACRAPGRAHGKVRQ